MNYLKHPQFIICLILKYFIGYLLFQDIFAAQHDNLDSEVVYSVVKGRYLANGFDAAVFKVFLGGVLDWFYFDRLFSPLTILYAIFNPKWAYFITDLFGLILAYAGMLTLLNQQLGSQKYTPFFSIIFAFGISYSSYGFGLHATPLIIAILTNSKFNLRSDFLIAFFLGTLSSLVLHAIFIPVVILSYLWIFRLKTSLIKFIITLGGFSLGAFVSSATLFFVMFQDITFHRSQWVFKPEQIDATALILKTFSNILTLGPWYHGQYTPSIIAICTILAGLISEKPNIRRATILIVSFILISSLLGDFKFYYTDYLPIGLTSIQFTRLGLFSGLLVTALAASLLTKESQRSSRILVLSGGWLSLSLTLLLGAGISPETFKNSFSAEQQLQIKTEIKSNGIRAIFSKDLLADNPIDWAFFHRINGGFRSNFKTQIYYCFSKHIIEGRVLTVGYDPMVAAYHGIPVLDGYHNLYPLSYKNAFSAVISNQLPLSYKGPKYYYEWGNRVYSFVDTPNNISLNFEAAKALGARYVISSFTITHNLLSKIAPDCGTKSGFHLYKILDT